MIKIVSFSTTNRSKQTVQSQISIWIETLKTMEISTFFQGQFVNPIFINDWSSIKLFQVWFSTITLYGIYPTCKNSFFLSFSQNIRINNLYIDIFHYCLLQYLCIFANLQGKLYAIGNLNSSCPRSILLFSDKVNKVSKWLNTRPCWMTITDGTVKG